MDPEKYRVAFSKIAEKTLFPFLFSRNYKLESYKWEKRLNFLCIRLKKKKCAITVELYLHSMDYPNFFNIRLINNSSTSASSEADGIPLWFLKRKKLRNSRAAEYIVYSQKRGVLKGIGLRKTFLRICADLDEYAKCFLEIDTKEMTKMRRAWKLYVKKCAAQSLWQRRKFIPF